MSKIESHQWIGSSLWRQLISIIYAAKRGDDEKVNENISKMEEDSGSSADKLLESTNRESAEKIANTLRDKGEQKFGPMWSECDGVLSNGRGVHLQASADTLEINILPTDGIPLNTHVRYDLTTGNYNTYEVRKLNGQPVVFYQVHDKSISPIKLSSMAILNRVGGILRQADLITSALPERKPQLTLAPNHL